jgi:hypothetical protein
VLATFAVYLLAHFLVYVVFLRNSSALRSERGIFVFHFISAAAVGLGAIAYALIESAPASFGFPGVALVLSAHGIYSLSFLELWSLAQGGYSLSIMEDVASAQAKDTEPDFSALERIGEAKLRQRILTLEKLGLIDTGDSDIVLTKRGRAIAGFLYFLLNWIEPRKASREPA